MPLWQGWVRSGEARLHYLDTNPDAPTETGLPLVIVPGTAESAEDYIGLFEALTPRRCIALSLRGRGQSSAPQAGYTLKHHATDIEALANALNLPPFYLLGYGRSVTYAIAYAARNPQRVAGLILAEYPAHHDALPLAWVDGFMESTWRGMHITERLMPHVIEGLQRESQDVPLWDYLPRITCPTLIQRGEEYGARLSLEHVEGYLTHLPNARVNRFPESGHDLWEPDFGAWVVSVGDFLARLDSAK